MQTTYRVSMSRQVLQLLLREDRHADAFDLVVHLAVDSRTSGADEDVEVNDAVHRALTSAKIRTVSKCGGLTFYWQSKHFLFSGS